MVSSLRVRTFRWLRKPVMQCQAMEHETTTRSVGHCDAPCFILGHRLVVARGSFDARVHVVGVQQGMHIPVAAEKCL